MTKQSYELPAGTPFERIVKVAKDLFFTKGYRATGINEVISKSGVAKATFYNHFKSKDELCREYLRSLHSQDEHLMEKFVAQAKGPVNKFLAPIRSLETLMLESDFRGCAFMNIASEVPDCCSPLRQEGIKVYDGIASKILELSEELIASDPEKFAGLKPQKLADDYMMVFSGAIALSGLYADVWPIKRGVKTLQKLIRQDCK